MKRLLASLLVTSSIVGSVSIAYAQHAMMDDKELMTKLKDAAPSAYSRACNGHEHGC